MNKGCLICYTLFFLNIWSLTRIISTFKQSIIGRVLMSNSKFLTQYIIFYIIIYKVPR